MKEKLPGLKIKDIILDYCLFQGGMGIGASLGPLSGGVSKKGGFGIISSAGVQGIVSYRDKKKVSTPPVSCINGQTTDAGGLYESCEQR